MAIDVYFGNRLETLLDHLVDNIAEEHRDRDPFEPTFFIVPNRNIRKWLQLSLANRHGIATNLSFHYLESGMWSILDTALPENEDRCLLEPKQLQLMLMTTLMQSAQLPAETRDALRPITDYLHRDDDAEYAKRLWQLSTRLARLFREYAYHRQDMIAAWNRQQLHFASSRPDALWMERCQRALYQAVFARGRLRDQYALNRGRPLTLPELATTYQHSGASLTAHPPVHVFGLSQFSPFHRDVLLRLGADLRVNIYQVNICAEFWEDVQTPQEERWQRIQQVAVQDLADGEELAAPEWESELLKQWGKPGRENIKLLSQLEELGLEHISVTPHLRFDHDDTPSTVLAHLQQQVLRRQHTVPDSLQQDHSLQIAACPGIWREAECVYQSIVHNLRRDPTLSFADIAVLVPEVERYKPVIQGVFGRDPELLPYNLSDSTAAEDSVYGQGVLSLLSLASGNFSRRDVFTLILNPCFLTATRMGRDDVLTWYHWAESLNVFHCFDQDDKARSGYRQSVRYTWQQGLQRLRLGRIMTPPTGDAETDGFEHYAETIPYADMESASADQCEAFSIVIESLFRDIASLADSKRSASDWYSCLNPLLERFLQVPTDRAGEERVRDSVHQELRELAALDTMGALQGRPASLSLDLIRECVQATLAATASQFGSYLSRGVTISSLRPMRPIPFRVVYVMGMEEGRFPGHAEQSTLDLRNLKRRIGDISTPEANQYMFLEVLMSTRERLYLSYVSKELQKDQIQYPCSVLNQLIKQAQHTLGNTFQIVEMPLTGSSLTYLSKPTHEMQDWWVNYDHSDQLAALHELAWRQGTLPTPLTKWTAKLQPTTAPAGANDQPATKRRPNAASDGPIRLDLRDLALFLRNPVEAGLRFHQGLYERPETTLGQDAEEPFVSAYPQRSRLLLHILRTTIQEGLQGQALYDGCMAYLDAIYADRQRRGDTPDGGFGELDRELIRDQLQLRLMPERGVGLAAFTSERPRGEFHSAVTLGSSAASPVSLRLPPLLYNTAQGVIELSGHLPLVWKNDGSGVCETLLLTDRFDAKGRIQAHMLLPFLFFHVLRVGEEPKGGRQGRAWLGDTPFILHVAHPKGIDSWLYRVDPATVRRYVFALLNEFMLRPYDLLPFEVLANQFGLIRPWERAYSADAQAQYAGSLADAIAGSADDPYSKYRPPELLRVVNADVPADAFRTVAWRLAPVFSAEAIHQVPS